MLVKFLTESIYKNLISIIHIDLELTELEVSLKVKEISFFDRCFVLILKVM